MALRRVLVALALGLAAVAARAEPLVSIIIDDIGDRYDRGSLAVELPAPVTLSFLPHTPFAARLARRGHGNGHEIMLHLPMEAVSGRRLGPGGVTANMSERALRRTVRDDLASIPYAKGFNNHMGSLLTRHTHQMNWVMSEIARRNGVYFVDSVTTRETVASTVAMEHGLPTTRRDIFLDNVQSEDAIRRQMARLLAVARQQGSAVAIGHPYPTTLAVLADVLPRLPSMGVRMVPVSELIAIQQDRSPQLWQASLSPSPEDAKNSKP